MLRWTSEPGVWCAALIADEVMKDVLASQQKDHGPR